MEQKLIAKFQRGGRRGKPAGFSFLTRRCAPDERLRITRYLTGCRQALVEDLGGEENLSAQRLILIDRLISLLGVIRGIEEFCHEDIMNSDGSLKPALGKSYLAYVNSARQILCVLGLERASDQLPSIRDIIAEFDAGKANEKGQQSTTDGRKQ
jgi:hypothetical protein